MLHKLRDGMARVQHIAGGAAFAAGVLSRSGFLSALSATGLGRFARDVRGTRAGPHLAFMLHARNKPDKVALVQGARSLTYGEMDREVNQVGHALLDAGVTSRDRVAIMLPNSCEHLVLQQAIARLGMVAVQVGYRLKAQEIAYILDNAGPRAVFVHADYQQQMDAALAEAGIERPAIYVIGAAPGARLIGERYEDAIARFDGGAMPRAPGADGGAVIVYTSGTTGKPKGATRDMRKTGLESVGDMVDTIGMRHDDCQLVVCPLYHSAAPAFAAIMLALGGTLVILDHFEPEAVLAEIARHRVTCAFMVPTMLVRLAALPEGTRARHDTSSLRWVLSGAAPLATETARRFQEAYGDILWNFYGATETGLVTLAGPADHTARPGTIGRALRGNEVCLFGEDGREVPVGEVGELYARNATLITGYHRNPDATSRSMRDGFFSVGDMARVDADGYYYLESRKHDMVISGGVNIYPREIEDHLHTHPDILEVAVIGVPDAEWGESLKAFVVARPGAALTQAEVVQFCRDTLAGYKCPRAVVFLDELPHNPTGKVLKRELREL